MTELYCDQQVFSVEAGDTIEIYLIEDAPVLIAWGGSLTVTTVTAANGVNTLAAMIPDHRCRTPLRHSGTLTVCLTNPDAQTEAKYLDEYPLEIRVQRAEQSWRLRGVWIISMGTCCFCGDDVAPVYAYVAEDFFPSA